MTKSQEKNLYMLKPKRASNAFIEANKTTFFGR